MKRWLAMAAAVALVFTACGDDSDDDAGGDAASETTIKLRSAPNHPDDDNVAILAFLPAKATVATGTTVEWSFDGPEPHSVSFFPAGTAVPTPDKAEPFFAPTEVDGPYDGTTLANSGLRPFGPDPAQPFRLQFAKAGTYNYVCVIHPQMPGSIVVTDETDDAETQAAITERGDEELAKYLEEGAAAKKKLVEAADSSATNGEWTIEMGVTTANTDVLAFAPASAKVKVGDRITFVNNTGAPHTASFGGDLVPVSPEDPKTLAPAPGPSPVDLVAGVYLNSGVLPPDAPPGQGPPLPARSFTFVAKKAGTYSYVCIYHLPSAMVGTITVV